MKSDQRANAKLWRKIDERFAELRLLVVNAVLETPEMALGRKTAKRWHPTTPEAFDGAVGVQVKEWRIIPYNASFDFDAVEGRLETARRLVSGLDRMIRKRTANAEFAELWGRFCEYAGAIDLLDVGETSDMHAARLSTAKVVGGQRKWLALQYLRLMDAGASRKGAEATVFAGIVKVLKSGVLPAGIDRDWLQKLLKCDEYGKPQRLKSTYTIDGKFKKANVEAYRSASPSDIPPFL